MLLKRATRRVGGGGGGDGIIGKRDTFFNKTMSKLIFVRLYFNREDFINSDRKS